MKKHSRLFAMIITSLLVVAIPVYFVIVAPLAGQDAIQVAAAIRVVTVDINPSVQLSVDADNKVLEAKALNADAEALLATLNLEGLPAPEAVQLIVGAAVVLGYIDAAATDNYVAIGVEDNGDESDADEQQLEDELTAGAEQGLSDHHASGEVDMSVIAHERITAAATLGISPGKLNLIDRLAEALGLTRDEVLAEYKDASVKSIMKAMHLALGNGGDPETSPSPTDPGAPVDPTQGQGHENGQGNGNGNGHHNGNAGNEVTPGPGTDPGDPSTTPDVTGGATSVTGPGDDDEDDDDEDFEDDGEDDEDFEDDYVAPTAAPTAVPTAVPTVEPTAVPTEMPVA